MPVYAVALFVFLANFILIGLVEAYNAKLLFCKSDGRSFDELRTFSIMTYHSISLFTYGFGLNLLVTEIIKRLSGRLKPRMLN
jgi:fucose 4-O-acetylase-like acetyltransferase